MNNILKFTITGNPCSSKNAIRSGITKAGRNYTYRPKAIKDYMDNGLIELKEQCIAGFFVIFENNNDEIKHEYIDLPITSYVQVSFIFYVKDLRKRDLINLIQAPADLLQKAGIIENDCLIINLDGSKIAGIDKDNPRTEIFINII